jgi:small subunit ribosomal protein S6
MNIECNAEALAELKNAFRFNDAVLRNMVIARNKPVTEPSPMMTQKAQEERETQATRARLTETEDAADEEPASEEAVPG